MDRLERLIAAIWLGSGFFLILASSAAFRVAPGREAAADMVGAMLTRWHYIALAAPLALFALELRRVRPLILVLVFACLVAATAQGFVDLRIRSMRWSSPVSISGLHPGHPTRRAFGRLHALSMGLLLVQVLGAAAVVMAAPRREPAPESAVAAPSSEVEPVRSGDSPAADSDGANAPSPAGEAQAGSADAGVPPDARPD